MVVSPIGGEVGAGVPEGFRMAASASADNTVPIDATGRSSLWTPKRQCSPLNVQF